MKQRRIKIVVKTVFILYSSTRKSAVSVYSFISNKCAKYFRTERVHVLDNLNSSWFWLFKKARLTSQKVNIHLTKHLNKLCWFQCIYLKSSCSLNYKYTHGRLSNELHTRLVNGTNKKNH